MNLHEIILNDLINRRDIEKLLHLYNLNIINNKQKIIIRNKFLTDKSFIINSVEKYYLHLEKFKYKNEIIILYDLINDITEIKLKTYINKMIINNNFNRNDEAFLLFLLNQLLFDTYINNIVNISHDYNNDYNNDYIKKSKFRTYIHYDFIKLTDIKKTIGFLRVKDFNLNIENYIKSVNSNCYSTVYYKYNDENYIYSYKSNSFISSFSDYIDDTDIMLTDVNKSKSINKYNLKLKYVYSIFNSNLINTYININIFMYNDLYHISEYNESNIVTKNNVNLKKKYLINNPYIKSKYIKKGIVNFLISFLKGDIKCNKKYKGLIIDNKYIIKNSINNFSLTHYKLRRLIDKYFCYYKDT